MWNSELEMEVQDERKGGREREVDEKGRMGGAIT